MIAFLKARSAYSSVVNLKGTVVDEVSVKMFKKESVRAKEEKTDSMCEIIGKIWNCVCGEIYDLVMRKDKVIHVLSKKKKKKRSHPCVLCGLQWLSFNTQ